MDAIKPRLAREILALLDVDIQSHKVFNGMNNALKVFRHQKQRMKMSKGGIPRDCHFLGPIQARKWDKTSQTSDDTENKSYHQCSSAWGKDQIAVRKRGIKKVHSYLAIIGSGSGFWGRKKIQIPNI